MDESTPVWPVSTKVGRRTKGVIAGAVAAVLLAVPLFFTVIIAIISFEGGWENDSRPDPTAGVWWVILSVLLVAVPPVVGVVVAKVRSGIGSVILGAELVVAAVVGIGWLIGD